MDLKSLGLEGSVQFHVSPTLLAIDERAHQVFQGFAATVVAKTLSSRFPITREVLVCREGSVTRVSLGELCYQEAHPDQWIVVKSEGAAHPGGVYGLVWVVDRLLGPGGCPWDQAQTHETLKRYLIEEAYELLQAIDEHDDEKMTEELGDVLLQPIMHSQMESLQGRWNIDDVASATIEKLIRRHPHVFGHPQWI